MLEQIGAWFRKLSIIACFVGLLTTFYALMFMGIPLDRNGKPKPPLHVQLLQTGAIFAAGLPGVIWGMVRVGQGKERDTWE